MSAALTISVELELAWGVHDRDDRRHLSADGQAERAALRRLLAAADRYDVPISFDAVGHLLLEECQSSHDGPHRAGWLEADPGTDTATDPLFYAPGMADAVLHADTDHELCTHTFSHADLSAVARETLDWELERARDLHDDLGAPVDSLVPPRHHEPPNRALRENGIRTARYAVRTDDAPLPVRAKAQLYGPHPLWEPQVVDGVLETYCTTYPSLTASSLPAGARPAPRPLRAVPAAVRRRLHLQYLKRSTRRAIETGSPLHLWCHLFDLANDHQLAVVEAYFAYLGSLPERDLRVLTMTDLADRWLSDRLAPH
jgi:peptidoglycan/xylan/chitin deacetylase (PgdA/CDA1 family)